MIRRIDKKYQAEIREELVKCKGSYINLRFKQIWRRRAKRFLAYPNDYSKLYINKTRYILSIVTNLVQPL